MTEPEVRPRRRADPAHPKWMWLVVALSAFLQMGIARGEVVERKQSEEDDAFMARVVGPSAELAQKVVRSIEIAPGKLALIGFVGGDALVGHLLIETSPGHFDHVKFASCGEEGGPPELLAVFFARTKKGGGRDLAVLCSWEHGGQIVNSTCYGAEFYRLIENGTKIAVERATELDKAFVSCDSFEVNGHGKWVHRSKPVFTTVRDVKRLLVKKGFSQ